MCADEAEEAEEAACMNMQPNMQLPQLTLFLTGPSLTALSINSCVVKEVAVRGIGQ